MIALADIEKRYSKDSSDTRESEKYQVLRPENHKMAGS
jgi:hypothetical protein